MIVFDCNKSSRAADLNEVTSWCPHIWWFYKFQESKFSNTGIEVQDLKSKCVPLVPKPLVESLNETQRIHRKQEALYKRVR